MTASPDDIFNTTQIPHLLTVLIFLPTAGVAVMAFFQNDTHIKHVAFWTSAAEFCLSLALYAWFDPMTHRMQFAEVAQWIPTPPIHSPLRTTGIRFGLQLSTP